MPFKTMMQVIEDNLDTTRLSAECVESILGRVELALSQATSDDEALEILADGMNHKRTMPLLIRIGIFIYRWIAGSLQVILVGQEIVTAIVFLQQSIGGPSWIYTLGMCILNLSAICYGHWKEDKVCMSFAAVVAVEYGLWAMLGFLPKSLLSLWLVML